MSEQQDPGIEVWIGLDVGKHDHHATLMDAAGSKLADRAVKNRENDLAALLDTAEGLGVAALVIDQPGSIGTLAVHTALGRGVPVAYIPGLVMRRAADLYPGESKTDKRDSLILADHARLHAARLHWLQNSDDQLQTLQLLAGRHALAATDHVTPKRTDGIVEAIRQLRVARNGAGKAKASALHQLSQALITAPDELRSTLQGRTSTRGTATRCATLRPDPTRLHEPEQAAKAALRSIARRIIELEREIADLDQHLTSLLRQAAPQTMALLGVSTGHAGQLIVTAGQNIDRLRNDGAFAALCGTSPVPVSSGRTDRYRLNHGGDRQANRALHMIVVCRLRYCERTRAYLSRRTAEGKTKRETMRCLKRYVAREIYNTLRADLTALNMNA